MQILINCQVNNQHCTTDEHEHTESVDVEVEFLILVNPFPMLENYLLNNGEKSENNLDLIRIRNLSKN